MAVRARCGFGGRAAFAVTLLRRAADCLLSGSRNGRRDPAFADTAAGRRRESGSHYQDSPRAHGGQRDCVVAGARGGTSGGGVAFAGGVAASGAAFSGGATSRGGRSEERR